jgi:hypothetical protein
MTFQLPISIRLITAGAGQSRVEAFGILCPLSLNSNLGRCDGRAGMSMPISKTMNYAVRSLTQGDGAQMTNRPAERVENRGSSPHRSP